MSLRAESDMLNQVGTDTPIGALLRQYWIPALMPSELPERDGPAMRLRLLGEDLVAYRDSTGKVGLLGEYCPHRGASLYFGRNEDCGLRCVYHGWKFDATGQCVDMPNEPVESDFKEKVKHVAYPCVERGGIIFAYMGPRKVPPPLPDMELLSVPPENRVLSKAIRKAPWATSMDGDLDTAHIYFLHSRLDPGNANGSGYGHGPTGVHHKDVHPRLEVIDTDYGLKYGARRDDGPDNYYWRITQYLFPFYTLFAPIGFRGVPGHIWVPIDDQHTMVWSLTWTISQPLTQAQRLHRETFPGGFLPATSDNLGRWRLAASAENDYFRDINLQKTTSYTGMASVPIQDWAVCESMNPNHSNQDEHLGTTDIAIIRVRRRLMRAAAALREQGITPPGVDDPALYRVRSGAMILPRNQPWQDATKPYLEAYSDLPIAAA